MRGQALLKQSSPVSSEQKSIILHHPPSLLTFQSPDVSLAACKQDLTGGFWQLKEKDLTSTISKKDVVLLN